MNNKRTLIAAMLTAVVFAIPTITILAQQDEEAPEMGFFVTSTGLGDGGNLGGLAGADAHCQSLANAVGSNRAWTAYLSTQGSGAVNAKDRIGSGPWANANGLIMATTVESLHYDNSNFNWEFALDENGSQFASRIDGDPDFTVHDILTGTQIDGTAFPTGQDQTCNNWISNNAGSARVGHGDRYNFTTPGSPWNSSHGTPGCTQENLVSVGGAGLLYCFATD